MRLETAVRRAIRGAELTNADAAAKELALWYAREIDGGADLAKVGPLLLAVLDSLGLTPKARGVKGGPRATGPDPLDELQQRRADRRQRDPAPVDPSAT